jgi:DNA-binding transcriptional LysR family regulator
MELRHLRYFVAVAEEQNITRAAERLHVSQPPLSRQIRDLEDELGVSLFERSAKSVRLTQAGRVFLEEARAVLERAAAAVDTVKAVSTGRRGEIHVGYAPSLTVQILPRTLRAFQSESPDIRVQLHDLTTEEMVSCLREGKIHVALMVQLGEQSLRGLRFIELARYSICVAAHPAHPCSRKRKVGIGDIADERFITYSRKDYPEYHEMLERLFRPIRRAPRIGEEHDSSTSLIAAVEAGRGVAIVPESLKCLAGERLKLRALSPAPDPIIVGLAYFTGSLPKAADAFIQIARREASQ